MITFTEEVLDLARDLSTLKESVTKMTSKMTSQQKVNLKQTMMEEIARLRNAQTVLLLC